MGFIVRLGWWGVVCCGWRSFHAAARVRARRVAARRGVQDEIHFFCTGFGPQIHRDEEKCNINIIGVDERVILASNEHLGHGGWGQGSSVLVTEATHARAQRMLHDFERVV